MVQPQVAMPLPIPVTLQPQPPQEDGLVYWSIAPEDRRHDVSLQTCLLIKIDLD